LRRSAEAEILKSNATSTIAGTIDADVILSEAVEALAALTHLLAGDKCFFGREAPGWSSYSESSSIGKRTSSVTLYGSMMGCYVIERGLQVCTIEN
jgi:hypothetical protein